MVDAKSFIPFQNGYLKIRNIYHRFDTAEFPMQYKGEIENIIPTCDYKGALKIRLKKGTVQRYVFKKGSKKKGGWVKNNKKRVFVIQLKRDGYFVSYDTKKLLIITKAESDYEICFFAN